MDKIKCILRFISEWFFLAFSSFLLIVSLVSLILLDDPSFKLISPIYLLVLSLFYMFLDFYISFNSKTSVPAPDNSSKENAHEN